MKNIHPKIYKIKCFCSCNNIINISSIIDNNINIDICYKCHPFYTGKQKKIKNKGRIEKFNKKLLYLIK